MTVHLSDVHKYPQLKKFRGNFTVVMNYPHRKIYNIESVYLTANKWFTIIILFLPKAIKM